MGINLLKVPPCVHPRLAPGLGSPAHPVASINVRFAALCDPRLNRVKAHSLSKILVLAICAVIAGATDWEAVAEFGRSKHSRIGWPATTRRMPTIMPS